MFSLTDKGAKKKTHLPPKIEIRAKSIAVGEKNSPFISIRKNSLHWAPDDLLGSFLSSTPPSSSPGSAQDIKRSRSGSVSGRLRSASDLEERGVIDRYQKGILKDLIISGDESLKQALEEFEKGDSSKLEALIESGTFNRKGSIDLMDELDFGFLNVGSLRHPDNDVPEDTTSREHTFEDFDFDSAFLSIPTERDISFGNLVNSLPSTGMGITPPNPFGFVDEFLASSISPEMKGKGRNYEDNDEPKTDSESGNEFETSSKDKANNNGKGSQPIGIPGGGLDGSNGGASKKLVGAYSPDSRRKRIEKFLEKRQRRVWTKKVKYDVRKNFADSRLRVKGRFVKKEDEQVLRELLSYT